jgi:hypothetical protein
MDNLVIQYREHLGLKNANFLRIDHDDAMVALVYKITQPNAAPLILKICSRSHDYLREVYFLKYFSGKLPSTTHCANYTSREQYPWVYLNGVSTRHIT